jgi:hypothetical protein
MAFINSGNGGIEVPFTQERNGRGRRLGFGRAGARRRASGSRLQARGTGACGVAAWRVRGHRGGLRPGARSTGFSWRAAAGFWRSREAAGVEALRVEE